MLAGTTFDVLAEFFPNFTQLDKFEHLAPFDGVPTTIVCGTKDKLTSIGHSRKMAEQLPNATLVECEGAGHMVIFEAREQVNEALEALVESAEAMTEVLTVDGSRAADVLAVIHEAFANRPPLDPPATALDETVESVARGARRARRTARRARGQARGRAAPRATRAGCSGCAGSACSNTVRGLGVAAQDGEPGRGDRGGAQASAGSRSRPAWSCRRRSTSGASSGTSSPAATATA